MHLFRYLPLLICISLVSGCGKINENAPALGSTAKHPIDWISAHRGEYIKSPDQCRSCHGNELTGGITKIDCFNQAGLSQCHADGHGPRPTGHSLPFKDPALHGTLAKKDLLFCQACHGDSGGAGSNPSFNISIGSLTTGCEASGCHLVTMAHPKPWKSHGSSGNLVNACALCHGSAFGGGHGPACSSCHKLLVAGIIPVFGQCVSCHGNPPNGLAAPNRAGSHAVHLALTGVSGNCSVCHNGGGSGGVNHGSALTTAFAANITTNSGTASFNGTSCANISCHGGQTTPIWGGSLTVLSNCTKCHQSGAAEYTGYYSGQHTKHLNTGIACTDCHDMSNTSAHFGNVTTKLLETQPYSTLRSYLSYNQSAQSCTVSNPPPQGVQFTGCHSGSKNWK